MDHPSEEGSPAESYYPHADSRGRLHAVFKQPVMPANNPPMLHLNAEHNHIDRAPQEHHADYQPPASQPYTAYTEDGAQHQANSEPAAPFRPPDLQPYTTYPDDRAPLQTHAQPPATYPYPNSQPYNYRGISSGVEQQGFYAPPPSTRYAPYPPPSQVERGWGRQHHYTSPSHDNYWPGAGQFPSHPTWPHDPHTQFAPPPSYRDNTSTGLPGPPSFPVFPGVAALLNDLRTSSTGMSPGGVVGSGSPPTPPASIAMATTVEEERKRCPARGRRHTGRQKAIMQEVFDAIPVGCLDASERSLLAAGVGLTMEQIRSWWQSAKTKRTAEARAAGHYGSVIEENYDRAKARDTIKT